MVSTPAHLDKLAVFKPMLWQATLRQPFVSVRVIVAEKIGLGVTVEVSGEEGSAGMPAPTAEPLFNPWVGIRIPASSSGKNEVYVIVSPSLMK